MDATKKILLSIWWGGILLCCLIVIAGESDQITLVDNLNTEFLCHTTMIFLTIIAIPLSLRLFKIERVRHKFKTSTDKTRTLKTWGMIRLFILGLPLVLNTLFYYLYENVAFFYLAVILVLASVFVYPSKNRCETETETT